MHFWILPCEIVVIFTIAGNYMGIIIVFPFKSGEKALLEFLQEEIATEKAASPGHLPSQLDSFQIKYDGAEVELTKQSQNEK